MRESWSVCVCVRERERERARLISEMRGIKLIPASFQGSVDRQTLRQKQPDLEDGHQRVPAHRGIRHHRQPRQRVVVCQVRRQAMRGWLLWYCQLEAWKSKGVSNE